MSYITTVSGKHFDPVKPDKEKIDIRDIAHSLSLICRANGHVTEFYSVAQHSIACAKEAAVRDYAWEVVAGCLLHDASEAYLSDVTRPVKKDLTYYLEVEDRLQNLIWETLIGRPLTETEKALIFEIDDQMLAMEFYQLMPEEIDQSYQNLKCAVKCVYIPPKEIERAYLAFYQDTVSSGRAGKPYTR